jgi:hypothetical protein
VLSGLGGGKDRAAGVGEHGEAAEAGEIEGLGDDPAARGGGALRGRVGVVDPDVGAPRGGIARDEAGDVAAAQRARRAPRSSASQPKSPP